MGTTTTPLLLFAFLFAAHRASDWPAPKGTVLGLLETLRLDALVLLSCVSWIILTPEATCPIRALSTGDSSVETVNNGQPDWPLNCCFPDLVLVGPWRDLSLQAGGRGFESHRLHQPIRE